MKKIIKSGEQELRKHMMTIDIVFLVGFTLPVKIYSPVHNDFDEMSLFFLMTHQFRKLVNFPIDSILFFNICDFAWFIVKDNKVFIYAAHTVFISEESF